MERRKVIQASLDYIEENLKAELTATELAQMAGYSLFHYYRVFHGAVGMPVMQYVLRRRLLHAIYEIRRGKSGVRAALEYGFDTYAGFYKGFVREFGATPSVFLKTYGADKPYRIELDKEECIMVTRKKAGEIIKNWNVCGEITDLGGAYAVGEDHVLKYTANLGKVKNHTALSRALEEAGLGAAAAVETADGREFVRDGEVYYYLTRRIPGETMRGGEYDARSVGEVIGQLHAALAKVDACVDDADLLAAVRDWALPGAKDALGLEEGFCRKYLEKLAELYPKLPRQIIHRDPNPGNIIRGGDGWGFVDFELSERNARIYDPCYAATAVLSETFPGGAEGWLDTCRELLTGYDSVAKLTEEEKEAVPYIILANQLVCVAWFAEQEKYRDLLETNKKMTRWLMDRLGLQ